MTDQLVKTKSPGIYRRGERYVVKARDASGRMLTRTCATMAQAKDAQAAIRADAARGESTPKARMRFEEYARDWIDSYAGRTSRGLKVRTREDYRRVLENRAIPYFGRMQLASITPRDVKGYAAHLAEQGISPATVRRCVAPLKALLATAFEDGIIRANPSANVRLAQPQPGPGEQGAKALSPAQLRTLLKEIPPQWRQLIEFLVCTGLRIGEAVALQWRDVDLDAGSIRVRRSYTRGEMGTPKSRFGVRTVPLSPATVAALTDRHNALEPSPDDLVFSSGTGNVLSAENVLTRVYKPAAVRAGVPWATVHTLRHTFASNCFRAGCNAKQVQRLLGHHSAAFTLETYVHLLPEDLPRLDFLDGLLGADGVV